MDPRHLVQLATILEKGSITRASQHLHLTQPTLTHNMQTLEMQVGAQLFERSRLGVRSTPLGEMLAREGREIMRRMQDAQAAGVRNRLGMRKQIRLGAGPMVGAALLPGLTELLLARHPDIALMLQADRPHLLVDQLRDGQYDLVIAPSWLDRPPPGIERTLLVDDTLGIFCGPSHPLAPRGRILPADAEAQRWISLGMASPFDKDNFQMLAEAGVDAPRTEITVLGDAFALLRIVTQGRHLAMLPRFPVRLLGQTFPLVELEVRAKARPRPIFLWCRTEQLGEPAFARIRQAVLDHVEGLVVPPMPAPAETAGQAPRRAAPSRSTRAARPGKARAPARSR